MRRRMVAIHVAVLVLVPLTLCVTPVADACPVCEEGDDDGFVQGNGVAPVNSTATVTITDDNTAAWSVVNDVSLGPNQSLASPGEIENRVRDRLQSAAGPNRTIETLSVDVEGERRVTLTFTVSGTVHSGPNDVVIYDGFAVDDEYSSTVVNARSLLLRGPGESVYVTKDGTRADDVGIVRDGTVRYERNDWLDTDTLVVFGMANGVRGSLELRYAVAAYHQDRLRGAAVWLLIPAVVAGVAVLTVSRSTGTAGIVASPERLTARSAIAALTVSVVAAVGLASGLVPLSAVTSAYAAGLGLLALSTFAGERSRRAQVLLALCGTVLLTAIVGVVLAALGGGASTAEGSAVAGPPRPIATPGSVGIGHAVWSTLVAVPMALGAAGPLDRRAHVLGAVGLACVAYAVLLAWWWPVVAPVSVAWYLASVLLATLALVVIALLAYATGYAFRAPLPDEGNSTDAGGS
ncbi:hypothetical protein [Salinarchaeum laminariae]|uniref:hypothetical protein n=1 Tax=Salinarchaeum laminariae TaxID=869888 RepID=UPI0020C07382|nr:hypothetical protein [Salinarchaeum laminariae]